ncbi:unnamed protein product, partial [Ectocarpus sp. 4 AP-2014]
VGEVQSSKGELGEAARIFSRRGSGRKGQGTQLVDETHCRRKDNFGVKSRGITVESDGSGGQSSAATKSEKRGGRQGDGCKGKRGCGRKGNITTRVRKVGQVSWNSKRTYLLHGSQERTS